MDPHKKILLGMLILTVFVFIVALSSLYVQIQIETGNTCGCVIPVYLFIPLLASIGLFIGVLVYYLLSPKFESSKMNLQMFLNLFPKEHASILQILLNYNGKISQARLTKESGLPKVKVFRILESLKRRGIINKEKKGKTNIISLNEKFKKFLKF